MEQRWNDIDRRKPKYSEKNPSQLPFAHHVSRVDWTESELRPSRLEAGDQATELLHSLNIDLR
jgi:hypothetical protein